MRTVTSNEMAELDRHAICDLKIPSLTLMENAGRAVAEEAAKMSSGPEILVVCGKGNNGGDGFVAARHLWDLGFKVTIILIGLRDEVKADPQTNLQRLNLPVIEAPDYESFIRNLKVLKGADLIIDAIFGIGLDRELGSPYKAIVTLINELNVPILAVDVPSGLDATTGKIKGSAIKAAKTVTFAAAKTGFYKADGPGCVGQVVVVDIGIPV